MHAESISSEGQIRGKNSDYGDINVEISTLPYNPEVEGSSPSPATRNIEIPTFVGISSYVQRKIRKMFKRCLKPLNFNAFHHISILRHLK